MEGHANDARVRAAGGPRHAVGASRALARGAAVRGFAATAGPAHRAVPPRLSGADGNERLTAVTSAVLLVLLAAGGVTIVFLRPLLPVHFFVDMLERGPVLETPPPFACCLPRLAERGGRPAAAGGAGRALGGGRGGAGLWPGRGCGHLASGGPVAASSPVKTASRSRRRPRAPTMRAIACGSHHAGGNDS